MKRKDYFIILFSSVFFLMGASVAFGFRAKEPRSEAAGPPRRAARRAVVAGPQAKVTAGQRKALEKFPNLKVSWDRRRGVPRSIRGFKEKVSADSAGEAVSFLNKIRSSFRMRDASSETRLRMVQRDKLRFEHVRVAQYYRGIQVVGGELVVHINQAREIYAVNGRYYPDIDLSTAPAISGEEALSVGLDDFRGEPELAAAEGPDLVIYPAGSAYHLAYRYVITFGPYGAGRWVYYVDARTGEVLNRYDDIKYFPPPTDDGQHEDVDGDILIGEGGGDDAVQGWNDFTNSAYYLWNKNLLWYVYNVRYTTCGLDPDQGTYAYRAVSEWGSTDPTEMSAARNLYSTQDFFMNVLGRNSFDDSGTYARANVHFSFAAYGDVCGLVNAFWSGSYFNIGDGDVLTATSLAVLDIVAHEYGHAWTEYTSNLVYQYESGALNESFSDITGANVEFSTQPDGRGSYPGRVPGYADWLMGEDCWQSSTALRDMRMPGNTATVGAGNEQPSRYKGTYWEFGEYDNGGVHINSGVQNFFYYLLCEGGAGVNDGIQYNVAGIGVDNARLVAYRVNTYYLVSSDDYHSARDDWVSAATDLDPSWVPAVEAAWDAVGVMQSLGTYYKDEDPDKWVPDANPVGVSSYIVIDESYYISYINVYVDIIHDWIGDLVVEVISPAGTTVKLHDRSGSSSYITGWYDRELRVEDGDLIDFYGEDARGVWTLRVSDRNENNLGTLNEWGLEIFGSASLLSSPWPMFRQDKKHGGRGRFPGPSSPILKWSYVIGDIVSSSPAVGKDGTIFVGSKDENVYSLDSNGALLWSYGTGYYVRSSPTLGGDSLVYIGGHNADSFHCLNSDGALNWSFYAGSYVRSSPLLGSLGEVYVGSDDNNFYCIDAVGSLRWSFGVGDYILSSPALGSNGEIYFGSGDYNLYALAASGGMSWSFLCGNVIWSSPAIADDGDIYIGSHDNNLYCFNSNGTMNWSHGTGGFVSSSPAIGADESTYIGSGDGSLYAIGSDGALRWSFLTGGAITYSSPAIGTRGRIYFGSEDDRIYGLTGDGVLSWSFQAGGDVRSSPAIGKDSLIVGSDDGRIYAVYREEVASLAIVKKEGGGDLNLYCYNSPVPGDWTYADASLRNPLPLARDLWVVPFGNDAVGLAATDLTGDLVDELFIVKKEAAGDLNLYLYNSPVRFDWAYYDAVARNPSPLGRDLWVIPSGNDTIGCAAIDITGDGDDELAILKKEGSGDVNLYFYTPIVPGDWTYWDAVARNPSALARDLWVMPQGNDAIGLAALDVDQDGTKELAILKKEVAGDINLYLYRSLVPGDWSFGDAVSRNPSALARDLWVVPTGNDAVAVAALDMDLSGSEELTILKKEGPNDINLYYYRSPVIGDWTYWDAIARNPSPIARDFWVIPSGNDAIGMTAIRIEQ